MAASLWKAWPTSLSFVIHGFVKCPVRTARSDVFRRSVRIITPEEQEKLLLKKQGYIVDDEKNTQYHIDAADLRTSRNKTKITNDKDTKFSKRTKVEKQPLKYEKLQEGDKRFGPLVNNAKSKKLRQKNQQILLEGERLISDAILAGAKCLSIYFTSRFDPNKLPLDPSSQIPVYKVQFKHMQLWSDVLTPPGIMAIFQMPATGEALVPQTQTIPLTLICDSIQDSGNMGSLIRTAAAVGCTRILTTVGCVDIWEPKVLRSGCGSHFRIPILNSIPWPQIPNYISSDAQILLASASFSDQLKSSKANSLNFEDLDYLVKNSENSDGNIEENVDENIEESIDENIEESIDETKETSENFEKDSKAEDLYSIAPIPSEPYEKFSFAHGEIVLVIGSEAHGLSTEARKLAFSRYGQLVYIPLAHGVESLNSVVAAGIIMFEIRKQISKKVKLGLKPK